MRELVVFSDFIAKIYPFRQYLYLYTTIVCSTYYKYLFRPYLYFCTSVNFPSSRTEHTRSVEQFL